MMIITKEQKERWMQIIYDKDINLDTITFSSPYLKDIYSISLLDNVAVGDIAILKRLRDYLDAHIRCAQFDPKNFTR